MFEGNLVTKDAQEETASTLNIISHSSAQTQRLGMRLGDLLRGGELILLEGQLGMGKTTFTQGLAQGMGIPEVISSPTFTLLKEYPGQLQPASVPFQEGMGNSRNTESVGPALYHFDLYRLEDPEEMFDLGFEEYFSDSSGVCVVEWADKAQGLWSAERLRVRMKILSETKRGLLFIATGARYRELLRQFQKNAYATASS